MPGVYKFLLKAKSKKPQLFTESDGDVPQSVSEDIMAEITCVWMAWKQLMRMKGTKERWSESDLASCVYSVLRSFAIQQSSYR
jgi:hypothetical protein